MLRSTGVASDAYILSRSRWLGAVGFLLAGLLLANSQLTHAAKPNVVLINVDDLGWTDLGCYGSDFYETPNIDRLAAGGMRFTDGYAACAVCSPSRAALMTGRYPARLGITDWIRARFQGGSMPADGKNPGGYTRVKGRPLMVAKNPLWMEHDEVTIAELLREAGYVTCHIGKWHLGMDAWYPQHQGFDYNFGGCDYGQPPSYFDPFANKRLPHGIPHLAGRRADEYLSNREADEAAMFIRKHAEQPFFLYLANYAVHTPIQGRPDLVAKYQRKAAGKNHQRPDYAAMVESVDECVGQVLATLDELSLTKNTLVIFTSDNGGLLPVTSNAPLKLGKGYAEEGGIRVPLIVRWPGKVKAGSVTDTPAIGVDILPTICQAVGVPQPADRPIDGTSLMPVILQTGSLSRDALFWHFPHYRGKILPYSIIRQGSWKLIKRYEGNKLELYHLEDDLSETTNLATAHPDRTRAMTRQLDRWLASVGAIVPKPVDNVATSVPPPTPKRPVSNHYHGKRVLDDYRWLENWDDPAVKAWSEAQNAHARSQLDRLPAVDAIRRRVTEIMSAQSVSYSSLAYRSGRFFAIKQQPPKEQPFLVTFDSLERPEAARTLLDPSAIDESGTTAIDWFLPSPDGKVVAISLSKGGSETGDVHLLNVDSGQQVGEVVPRVNSGTAGGDMAWLPNGTGFFYTRHPRPGERPKEDLGFYQQVYFHRLGTASDRDRYEMGKSLPRIAEIEFEMHRPTGRLLVTVQDGDGGQFAHYVRSPKGQWRQFSYFGDKIVQATFLPDGDLLLISRQGAPRGKVLRLAGDTLNVAAARLVIPEGEDTVVTSFYHQPPSLVATDTLIYLIYQLGGPSELRVFDHDGNPRSVPQQLPVSSVGGLVPTEGDQVLFTNSSFVDPTAYYVYDIQSQQTTKTKLAAVSPVDYGDVQVVREFATSKDGTKVPLNIIKPKSIALDGSNPLVLNGYGGYNISLTPRFVSTRKVLLEQGVIYVVANLRGGGEYGEQWHRQGNLTNKQNVFDDFAAVAEHLIERGYTSSKRLAIIGGSNGGLLMGATMTQRPKLMAAVVSLVGIYDMLRVELSPNGSFNIPEFGTVKDRAQFEALYAYSPYHHVRDGEAYPPTLFLTGANDPRVDPMQSRKMTARLQAASSSGEPILLRTSANSGHGGDTGLSERIEQSVDINAFLFRHLGVPYQAK